MQQAALRVGSQGLQFFAEDVVQEEFPNRLVPNGATRDLAALKEAAARSRREPLLCELRDSPHSIWGISPLPPPAPRVSY